MEVVTKQLTQQQKKEIRELVKTCNEKENLHQTPFLEQEWNYNSEIPCFFLLYKQEELVSFLSLYIPEEQEVEVNAYTAPAYRKKGYFSCLLKKAIQVLREYQISSLTFLIESHVKSSLCTLNSLGAQYLYSEYMMELTEEKQEYEFKNLPFSKKNISFLPTAIQDIENLSKIHAEAFEVTIENSKNFLSFLKEKNIISYKLVSDNEIIGFCNALCSMKDISIFAVCIGKEFQGQGYGKRMMADFIEHLKTYQKRIFLQVNNKNIYAVCLYKDLGFTVSIDYSYYSVKMSNQ